MSAYYYALGAYQELEWWLTQNPADFPVPPGNDENRGERQDPFYQHPTLLSSSSYPSPDHTPPMRFASTPAWTIDIPAATEVVPLVTPFHGHFNTSCKTKHSNEAPRGKKRYHCSYCAKDFSRDADRKRHEDCVHFGIRGFHCPYFGCTSRGFVRNYDLGRHMKSCRFRH